MLIKSSGRPLACEKHRTWPRLFARLRKPADTLLKYFVLGLLVKNIQRLDGRDAGVDQRGKLAAKNSQRLQLDFFDTLETSRAAVSMRSVASMR